MARAPVSLTRHSLGRANESCYAAAVESAFIEQAGRPKIHYAVFRPEVGEAKVAILLTPGLGEPIARYLEAIGIWTARGFLVAAHDLRGQGDSEGHPGHVDSFDDYVSDAHAVLSQLGRDEQWRGCDQPILFGHSTGGLIATHLALRSPGQFRGLALGSPFFGLALKTPAWKKLMGRVVTKVYPTFSQPTGITGAMVSHDPKMVADSDNDPKRVSRVTARWFTETEAAQELLEKEAHRLVLPLFCQAAGDDRVASLEQTRRVLIRAQSEDKQLLVHEGEFHELHRELKRDIYMRAFADQFEKWAETTQSQAEAAPL